MLNELYSEPLRTLLSGGAAPAPADDAAFISIDKLGADVRVRRGGDYSVHRVGFDQVWGAAWQACVAFVGVWGAKGLAWAPRGCLVRGAGSCQMPTREARVGRGSLSLGLGLSLSLSLCRTRRAARPAAHPQEVECLDGAIAALQHVFACAAASS